MSTHNGQTEAGSAGAASAGRTPGASAGTDGGGSEYGFMAIDPDAIGRVAGDMDAVGSQFSGLQGTYAALGRYSPTGGLADEGWSNFCSSGYRAMVQGLEDSVSGLARIIAARAVAVAAVRDSYIAAEEENTATTRALRRGVQAGSLPAEGLSQPYSGPSTEEARAKQFAPRSQAVEYGALKAARGPLPKDGGTSQAFQGSPEDARAAAAFAPHSSSVLPVGSAPAHSGSAGMLAAAPLGLNRAPANGAERPGDASAGAATHVIIDHHALKAPKLGSEDSRVQEVHYLEEAVIAQPRKGVDGDLPGPNISH